MRTLYTENANFDELISGDIEITVFRGRTAGKTYASAFGKERDTVRDHEGPTTIARFLVPKEKRNDLALFFAL